MSRGCLEGVCKLSNMYLEGISIVSGFWKVSGRYQAGLRKVFAKCLEGVWNRNIYLFSTRKEGLVCLEGVWKVSESCWRGIWKVSKECLEGAWKVFGRCLDGD